ncbi:hypothetical protein D3C76_1491970 [compost metagenome]
MHLVDQAWVNPRFAQHHGGTVSGIQLEALFQQACRQIYYPGFIAFTHRQQRTALFFHA